MLKKGMTRGAALMLALMTVSGFAMAEKGVPAPKANQVMYQIHLKGFASTDTADVKILVNATVNNRSLGGMQQQIMQKLKQFAPQETWNIVDFNRRQDSAGLETLRMIASARLTQSELNTLRGRVKTASKTGLKFEVQNINFQPSDVEYEKERALLREQVYQLVTAELARLNKQYPSQQFVVHQIDFLGLPNRPRIAPMMLAGSNSSTQYVGAASKTQSPTVGQIVYTTATVVLSSSVK